MCVRACVVLFPLRVLFAQTKRYWNVDCILYNERWLIRVRGYCRNVLLEVIFIFIVMSMKYVYNVLPRFLT